MPFDLLLSLLAGPIYVSTTRPPTTNYRYFHDWVGWACGSAWDSYYYTAFDHRGGTSPDYEQVR